MPIESPPPVRKFIDPPTPAEKAKVIECLKQRRHPAPYLRNFGVPFLGAPPTRAQLNQMSIPDLARYADHVIRTVAGNLELEVLTCGSEDDIRRVNPADMNECAAGGMAYLSLYGVPRRREMYLEMARKYQANNVK